MLVAHLPAVAQSISVHARAALARTFADRRVAARVGGDVLRPDGVAAQKRIQGRRKLGGMSQRQGVVSTCEHHVFSLR